MAEPAVLHGDPLDLSGTECVGVETQRSRTVVDSEVGNDASLHGQRPFKGGIQGGIQGG